MYFNKLEHRFLVESAMIDRSSRPEVFLRKSVLKTCCKFTRKHPCRSVISIKQFYWNHTSAWVFLCQFAAFSEHLLLRTTPGGCSWIENVTFQYKTALSKAHVNTNIGIGVQKNKENNKAKKMELLQRPGFCL